MIDRELSKAYVLEVAQNRVQLHRDRAAIARDGYKNSIQLLNDRKRDYQRQEDTLNQALAAYSYFEHMLPRAVESPSILAMNAPPSHEKKMQASSPVVLYTSSGTYPSV